MIELFAMIGAAFLLSLGTMFLAWCIYVFRKNASIADIGWAAAFILSAWAYLIIGDGYAPKRWLITLMVTIWAVRLGQHLLQRYLNHPEDARYAVLRKSWGGDDNRIVFLMMFLLQGALVVILSLPFLIVSFHALPEWSGFELFGFLIWAVGLSGESLADYQLLQFKNSPGRQTEVLKTGLWRFSRHPNYFFEWVVWIGFFIFCIPTPGGWIALISPAIMYVLLTTGTGIPMNEAEAIRTKGELYKEYQEVTPPFFPWFIKKTPRTTTESDSQNN